MTHMPAKKMVSSNLPVLEIYTYFLLFFSAILYSLYQVYLAGNLFDHSSAGDDFTSTWLGRKKDITDYEWTTFIPFLLHMLSPWIVVHVAVTEFTRWILVEAVPASYFLITSLFILTYFRPFFLICYITTVVFYFILLRICSRVLIWSFGVSFLIGSSYILVEISFAVKLNDMAHIILVVSNGWLHLHCMSFCFDYPHNSKQKPGLQDLFTMCGYCFYLPTFFIGPIILFDDFKTSMFLPFERWTRLRIFSLFTNLIRYFFWLAVTDFSLYFFYAHALRYHMEEMEKLGPWTFNGIGYFLGQFFCNKYIVLYGFSSTIAKAERYPTPPVPKCISRIHLYSEMWRSFDVGYYSFILKYIYIPLRGAKRDMLHKLCASFMCFAFVYVWHGIQLSIFVWSLLNFLGISLEAVGRKIANSHTYQEWMTKLLSPSNIHRFNAVVSAPLFAMAAVSNFYFFGGMKVGNVFMRQFLKGSWTTILSIWLFSYFMYHISTYVKEKEIARAQKSKLL